MDLVARRECEAFPNPPVRAHLPRLSRAENAKHSQCARTGAHLLRLNLPLDRLQQLFEGYAGTSHALDNFYDAE